MIETNFWDLVKFSENGGQTNLKIFAYLQEDAINVVSDSFWKKQANGCYSEFGNIYLKLKDFRLDSDLKTVMNYKKHLQNI